MDTADTRLAGLALSWLATRPAKRGGTRKELSDALRPFVEHRWTRPEWASYCEALVDRLVQDGLISATGRGGLALTADGKTQALRRLGLEQLPRGLTWKKLKATHLLACTLDLPPSRAVLARLADADGMRAALLKRQHAVSCSEAPSLAEVRDRLLWRQLGVDTEQPFTLRAVQAHLLGKLLESGVSDPKKAVEQLAARAAGAMRADAEAVRQATLRAWLFPADGSAPASAPAREAETATAPMNSIAAFAEHVLEVARTLPAGRFGNNKVFISHVWRALQPEWSSREAFNEALLEANRTRHLSLSRADLVATMDPTEVAASEVRTHGASFHFVVV